MSNWVSTEVLWRQKKLQVQTIEKFISLANKLFKLHNYNTLLAVLGGLTAFPGLNFLHFCLATVLIAVQRLVSTWKNVSKKRMKKFEALNNLMSARNNYKNLRGDIEMCLKNKCPLVPYLGKRKSPNETITFPFFFPSS